MCAFCIVSNVFVDLFIRSNELESQSLSETGQDMDDRNRGIYRWRRKEWELAEGSDTFLLLLLEVIHKKLNQLSMYLRARLEQEYNSCCVESRLLWM